MAKIYRARGHRVGDLFYSDAGIGPWSGDPQVAWEDAIYSGIIPAYVEEADAPTWTRIEFKPADPEED